MTGVIPILGSRMSVHMLNIKDRYGDSALMYAVYYGHLSCVVEMAKLEGVDWLTRDSQGDTLEDLARMMRHEHILPFLQKRKPLKQLCVEVITNHRDLFREEVEELPRSLKDMVKSQW